MPGRTVICRCNPGSRPRCRSSIGCWQATASRRCSNYSTKSAASDHHWRGTGFVVSGVRGRQPEQSRPMRINVTVDGTAYNDDVEPRLLLVHYLRDRLGKVGTVVGCDTSNCGACTVHLNGYSVKSCSVLAVQADGGDVNTVEGLSRDGGKLHPVQEAFRDNHALQCGFCTPGMIMQTIDLLAEDPDPDEAAVRVGLEGNLCRCTGYQNIVRAVQDAAQRLRATATDDTAADAKAVAAKADTAGGVR